MSTSLVGKVAIVTGSSRSIGAAIARRLAEVRTVMVIPLTQTYSVSSGWGKHCSKLCQQQ